MSRSGPEQLRADLAELAGHAAGVDLHQRVLSGSRRATVRRAAVLSAAAVVVLAGTATALAVRRDSPDRLQPARPAPSAPGSVAPSPAPSVVPPAPVPSQPSRLPALTPTLRVDSNWAQTIDMSLPGKLYSTTASEAGRVTLHVRADNHERTAEILGPLKDASCLAQTVVFAPDGQSVAWVEGDGAGIAGRAVVADLTGATRVVAAEALCVSGSAPKWTPDSAELIVTDRKGAATSVNVSTGVRRARPKTWADYVAWSPNGEFHAYQGTDGKLVVANTAGTAVHRVAFTLDSGGENDGFAAITVSDDGKLVGVGAKGTDSSTTREAHWLVDAVTGRQVSPPPLNGPAADRGFRLLGRGGLLLVQRGSVVVFGASWDASAGSTTLARDAEIQLYLP